MNGWKLFPLSSGAPDRTRSPDNTNHCTVDRWEKGTVFAVDQEREDGGRWSVAGVCVYLRPSHCLRPSFVLYDAVMPILVQFFCVHEAACVVVFHANCLC